MEKGMHKLMAPLALMLAVSFAAPADVSAKDGSGKSNDAGQSKEYKNGIEKADDKGGKGRGKDDDKGGGMAGSDDQLKTCYVFSSGGKLPRPVQRYITKGDEMRLLADDHMKRLAGMIYYDDTVRYPEKADDPKSYNPRYDLYSRDDRLGRKACILF
jgi:hypothetical protein